MIKDQYCLNCKQTQPGTKHIDKQFYLNEEVFVCHYCNKISTYYGNPDFYIILVEKAITPQEKSKLLKNYLRN
jgi:hypothetical protein